MKKRSKVEPSTLDPEPFREPVGRAALTRIVKATDGPSAQALTGCGPHNCGNQEGVTLEPNRAFKTMGSFYWRWLSQGFRRRCARKATAP